MNRETVVMHQIQIALSEAGCIVIRQNSGTYYSKDGQAVRIGFPGLPDLLAVNPKGEAVFLEVKPDHKSHRRPEQIKFIDAMKARGIRCGFVTSPAEALEVALK